MELAPLFTMALDLSPNLGVGAGPHGDRNVGVIRTASLIGDRLKAGLASPAAADWMVKAGAIGVIDARLVLRTDDDALIYMSYGGRLDLSDPAAGMFAYVAPVFETSNPRYAWLNVVQAVGKGRLTVNADGARLDYEFCQIL